MFSSNTNDMNVYSDLKKVGTFLKGRCSLHAGKMKDHKCNVAGRLGESALPGAQTPRPHTASPHDRRGGALQVPPHDLAPCQRPQPANAIALGGRIPA